MPWFTPAEVCSPEVIGQMTGGQDRLLRLALAHVGQVGHCRLQLALVVEHFQKTVLTDFQNIFWKCFKIL